MIARSKLTFDREYFAQYYSDWMLARSRFRKFAVPVGLLIIILGLILLTRFEGHRYLGLAVVGVGLFYLIDALTYRSRWIKKRLTAGGSKNVKFEFFDDRIRIQSDNSDGYILLSGLLESKETDRGVFLVPQKELSFYIPWESIEPREALPRVQALLAKTGRVAGRKS